MATISCHPPIVNTTGPSIFNVWLIDLWLWGCTLIPALVALMQIFKEYGHIPTFGVLALSICIGISIVEFGLLWLLVVGDVNWNAKTLRWWVFCQVLLFPFYLYQLHVTMALVGHMMTGITAYIGCVVFALGFYRAFTIKFVYNGAKALTKFAASAPIVPVAVPAAERKVGEVV